MRKSRLALVVAGLIGSSVGFAADGQVEAGRQCALIKDSLQRLVCYDRVFQSGDAPAVAQTGTPRIATPVPPTAVALTPPVKPSLGDESVQRKTKEEKAAEPTSLEANVTAIKETRPNVFRVTLDNGQVWQQMDMSSLFQIAAGDSVRIEKSTMGSFRLTRTSRGRSVWVRVTRLE